MPDLSTRTDHEEEIAALLLLLFDDYQQAALSWLATSPRASDLPGSFYSRIEREVADALEAPLAATHTEAGEQMADDLGMFRDSAQAARNAAAWAKQRAADLAADLVARIREAVAKVIGDSQAEQAEAAAAVILAVGFGAIFADSRAEKIGINETTGAITAGERNAADILADQFGVTVVATWRIEDEDACKLCKRVNGTTQDYWGTLYPNGPGPDGPHVGCRCYLTWEIEGVDVEPSEN